MITAKTVKKALLTKILGINARSKTMLTKVTVSSHLVVGLFRLLKRRTVKTNLHAINNTKIRSKNKTKILELKNALMFVNDLTLTLNVASICCP